MSRLVRIAAMVLCAACSAPARATALLQPFYTVPMQRSDIPVPVPSIPPGTANVAPFELVYWVPRSYAFLDFDHDGLLDILVAPAFGQHLPALPVEIWINRRDGTFENRTSQVIAGPIPGTWNATDVLTGDFNEDGVDDAFLPSSGAEHAVANGEEVQGYHSALLLSSPDGRFVDATASITPNVDTFNHMAAVGDWNGDGHLDFALNAFGTDSVPQNGIRLLAGDGTGAFVETVAGLSPNIRWMRFQDLPAGTDYQTTGCVGLGDLDGDGDSELITGSYTSDDRLIGPNQTVTRTVRIHRRDVNGDFVEQVRYPIPAAIANIGTTADTIEQDPAHTGLGCSQILTADLDGDTDVDILVQWEGNAKWYIHLLRNDGSFTFSDVTFAAMGRYDMGFVTGGVRSGPGHFAFRDINGDGVVDIVGQLSPTRLEDLASNVAFLNDGSGIFAPFVPRGRNGALMASDYLPVARCVSCLYLPLLFDSTGSGIGSLVLVDVLSSVTSTEPVMTTTVHLTTVQPSVFVDGFDGEGASKP